MILERLDLKNFRQFRGIQTLEFARDGKNVTVIFGENGRGKTSIFRAIMFCLYGDRRLSQDGAVGDKDLHLVNTAELEERVDIPAAPVEAYVGLRFSHGAHRYELRRALYSIRDNNGAILEELGDARLSIFAPDGNCKVENDPERIGDLVNQVLDRRVREYFLFDGEKIEHLTRASAQHKREVSKGVRNLLSIDALEVGIRAMRHLCKDLDSDLKQRATGEYLRVIVRITEISDRLEILEKDIARKEEELERASSERHDVEKKLEQYREIRGLLEHRRSLEEQKQEVQQKIDSILQEIKANTAKSSFLLCKDAIETVFSHIDERRSRGEIPPQIRKDLIEKILDDGACICGRGISPDTEPYRRIHQWLEKADDPVVQNATLELWRHLATTMGRFDHIQETAEKLLLGYANAKSSLQQVRRDLSTVNDKIGTSARKDAAELENQRKQIEKDVIRLTVERNKLEDEVEQLSSEQEMLLSQRKQLEQQEELRNELTDRASLASQALEALQAVFSEFTREARDKIAADATEVLHELLDEDSRREFSRIVVNDDYSLQILDRWDHPFLADISAGQRQVMSIAFIAALAKAAAGDKLLEMPLFMDTPFGRLSYEHRKNLIASIPSICAQWVLLATDTELRRTEGRLLSRGGKWGRFYRLVADDQGGTRIEARDVEEAVLVLHSDDEEVLR
jgi:DNA sulfur modification protein DndD